MGTPDELRYSANSEYHHLDFLGGGSAGFKPLSAFKVKDIKTDYDESLLTQFRDSK